MTDWHRVFHYEGDPEPDPPRVLEAVIQDRIVVLHQNARDIWLVTCTKIGLKGRSLATSNRQVAEQQAAFLVEKALAQIAARSGSR